ncbi:MAG TPA: bifunctional glycosyltransferase/class I SAM-dependent methyltransferase [Bryobacteraceae bacterium]|nr:bifunctional glycosyltransferase/class I SAM-dependent methyltransferase [Bryobacteraceae bacterium]
MARPPKPRLLVFIVAYNAEKTITDVVRRIPGELADLYDFEVLIIDDASQDSTFLRGLRMKQAADLPFPLHVLFNPVNLGYGGNQKVGFQYAIEKGFDFVALLHGDGQYAPECLPTLVEPLRRGEASAVFGSRMMTRMGALRGGMPLYKFAGNRILTWVQNRLLRSHLSEFHSGYRVYAVRALQAIPFERNSNGFDFDTEIIIQLRIARLPVRELPIPTYYGDEICHVNGLRYAWNVVAATLKARLQELSLFYDRRFDCAPAAAASPYVPKFEYASPHSMALDRIPAGSRVMDLGCAGGYMGAALKSRKQCSVSGVDIAAPAAGSLDEFQVHDLNAGPPRLSPNRYDFVLMLDVIEHLYRPEAFLEQLRRELAHSPETEVLLSTANIGFLVNRLMLLAGQFNYGKRGILDLTHTRLFTFASLRRALRQAGFEILETRGVPGPFPLALGDNLLSRALLALNRLFIRLAPGLFSYQMFLRVKALPSLESLLRVSEEQSGIRASRIESSGVDDGVFLRR